MTMLLKTNGLPSIVDGGSSTTGRVERLILWIIAVQWRFRAMLRQRRLWQSDLRELRRLDDRLLEDIGLTRADIPGEFPGAIAGWRTLEPWRD